MNMDATVNNKIVLKNDSNTVLRKLTHKDKYESNGRVNDSTITKMEVQNLQRFMRPMRSVSVF